MSSIDVLPLIKFFVADGVQGDLFTKFKKIDPVQSTIIKRFIEHGFEPVIEGQISCPQLNLPGWVWIMGEDELRNDWENIPFDRVFLLVRWNKDAIVSPSLKIFVKNVIECLLDLREYPTQITTEQQIWLDRIRPEKSNLVAGTLATAPIPIGGELKDGRKVTSIKGGKLEEQVNKLIDKIKCFV